MILLIRNSKETEDILKILCSIMKCDETEKTVILQAYRNNDVKEKKGMMMSIFGGKK